MCAQIDHRIEKTTDELLTKMKSLGKPSDGYKRRFPAFEANLSCEHDVRHCMEHHTRNWGHDLTFNQEILTDKRRTHESLVQKNVNVICHCAADLCGLVVYKSMIFNFFKTGENGDVHEQTFLIFKPT